MAEMYLQLAERMNGQVKTNATKDGYTFIPLTEGGGFYVRNDKLGEFLGKKKGFFKKFIDLNKKLGLAPFRRSFRTLIAVNAHGMASKLKKRIEHGGEGKLKKKWEQIGGKYSELLKSIHAGQKRKALLDNLNDDKMISAVADHFPVFQRNLIRWIQNYKHRAHKMGDNVTLTETETLGVVQFAAIIAAATPIIASIFGGKGKKAKDAGAVSAEDSVGSPHEEIIKSGLDAAHAAGLPLDVATADPADPAHAHKFEKDAGKDDAPIKDSEKIFGLPKIVVIGGGIGLAALFFLKKK